jgi:hypothetical protein
LTPLVRRVEDEKKRRGGEGKGRRESQENWKEKVLVVSCTAMQPGTALYRI